MYEKITLCGDNCIECPRYNANSDEELKKVAELWYRVAWRKSIVSNEEISCSGCSSHKQCTYHLVECIKEHNVEKCMEVCTQQEYDSLAKAFFNKENNLRK